MFPWIGIIVAILAATHNLLRKLIKVEKTDIGLFIESLFILPIAIVVFLFNISKRNE